jgi:hypothetical protein
MSGAAQNDLLPQHFLKLANGIDYGRHITNGCAALASDNKRRHL